MRPEAYQFVAERQRTYWWYRARRAMALSFLRRFGVSKGSRLIDIGCGPGGNLRILDALDPSLVVGVDLSPAALSLAAAYAPSATLVSADINQRLPFEDNTFDVATVFNVLYHQWVADEATIIAELSRILRPGGLLLITEPAFDVLKRELDDVTMTRRRYRAADFDPWLASAEFESLYSGYFTSFGYPILLVEKWLTQPRREGEAPKPGLDMGKLPAFLNAVLEFTAGIESRMLICGLRLPFGTTLIRVARLHKTSRIETAIA